MNVVNIPESTVKDLKLMETYFGKIKAKKDIESSCRAIERILHRVFDINAKINIVNNTTNKFFGMTITPKTMDRIIMAILDEKSNKDKLYEIWRKEKDWTIEIDSILLYDANLNTNPAEIVAVLLHEMGHVIYSNTAVSRANRVIKLTMIEAGTKYRTVLKNENFMSLLYLPFYESCNTKSYTRPENIYKEEFIADKFAIKYGYGEQLSCFIEKLLKSKGNSLIDRPEKELDHDVEVLTKWTVEQVSLLEFRKNRLEEYLEVEKKRNPSNVIKGILDQIKVFIIKEPAGTLYESFVVTECISNHICSLMEKTNSTPISMKNPGRMKELLSKRKVEKITERELMLLSVEVDKICYSDDKIYVIDLISDFIEKVEYHISLIDNGHSDRVPQTRQSLENILHQARDIQRRAVDIELKDSKYGLFVRYPKDYEG